MPDQQQLATCVDFFLSMISKPTGFPTRKFWQQSLEPARSALFALGPLVCLRSLLVRVFRYQRYRYLLCARNCTPEVSPLPIPSGTALFSVLGTCVASKYVADNGKRGIFSSLHQ
jgi:hypothetical protein